MSFSSFPTLRLHPSSPLSKTSFCADDLGQSTHSSPSSLSQFDDIADDGNMSDDDASSTSTMTPVEEDPSALWQLVYTSSATDNAMSPQDLQQILEYSRERNTRDDITGLLLYKGGSFAQFLEGPLGVITETYERIDKDDRHRGVCTLLRRPVSKRDFPRWSMGFGNLEDLSDQQEAKMVGSFQNVIDMSKCRVDDMVNDEVTEAIRKLVDLFHQSLSRSLWRKQQADSVIVVDSRQGQSSPETLEYPATRLGGAGVHRRYHLAKPRPIPQGTRRDPPLFKREVEKRVSIPPPKRALLLYRRPDCGAILVRVSGDLDSAMDAMLRTRRLDFLD